MRASLAGLLFWIMAANLCCFLLAPAKAYAENEEDYYSNLRRQMVQEQIAARGVKDERVLEAMTKVPRHKFVPLLWRSFSYQDRPLPIGHDQTISQPYIVALMSELAQCAPEDRILEIGTGSGYQAAILAELAKEVYTIEILKPLADSSRQRLQELGYANIQVKWGDGYLGWPEFAPYDAIVVTAAPPEIPQALVEQLKVGARMVIPVGTSVQQLKVITKTEEGIKQENIIPVRFVPMIGK